MSRSKVLLPTALAFAMLCACSEPEVGTPPGEDGGVSDGGSTDGGIDGMQVDKLHFVVTGDVRPPTINGPYPSAILTQVFQSMEARTPQFGVMLGDYVFASYTNTSADYTSAKAQMQTFLASRASFSKPLAYVVGNHENDGLRLFAYQELLSKNTYQAFSVFTARGEAKFLIVADDTLYDGAEDSWFAAQLARPTPYTFVFRHFPSTSTYATTGNNALANSQLAAGLAAGKVTMTFAGHSHQYLRPTNRPREAVSGTAGAPLVTGADYGYLIVDQLANGQIQVTRIDLSFGQTDTFTVTP